MIELQIIWSDSSTISRDGNEDELVFKFDTTVLGGDMVF